MAAGEFDPNSIHQGSSTIGINTNPPRKSRACPHCVPKCPHGYPIDDPWQITWQQAPYPNYTINCNT